MKVGLKLAHEDHEHHRHLTFRLLVKSRQPFVSIHFLRKSIFRGALKFIPLRLDECQIPAISTKCGKISLRDLQWIDCKIDHDIHTLARSIDESQLRHKRPSIHLFGILLLMLLTAYSVNEDIKRKDPLTVCKSEKGLSCGGEENFTSYRDNKYKSEEEILGRKALRDKKYESAYKELHKAWGKSEKNDPELLIALNNAKVMMDIEQGYIEKEQVFPIAIATGFRSMPENILKSILAGVAARQDEFNMQEKYKFIVLMANDGNGNNKQQSERMAKVFLGKPQILGIIGPYSSQATYYALDQYQGNITVVSATSTATINAYQSRRKKEEKTRLDMSYFFRPVPTTEVSVKSLISYLKTRFISVKYASNNKSNSI